MKDEVVRTLAILDIIHNQNDVIIELLNQVDNLRHQVKGLFSLTISSWMIILFNLIKHLWKKKSS